MQAASLSRITFEGVWLGLGNSIHVVSARASENVWILTSMSSYRSEFECNLGLDYNYHIGDKSN